MYNRVSQKTNVTMHSLNLAFGKERLRESLGEVAGLIGTTRQRFEQWEKLATAERRDVVAVWVAIRDLVLDDCRHSSIALDDAMEISVWSNPISLTGVLHDEVVDLLRLARNDLFGPVAFADLCLVGFFGFGVDVNALHQRDDLPGKTIAPRAFVVSSWLVPHDENKEDKFCFDLGVHDPGRIPTVWDNKQTPGPDTVVRRETPMTASRLATLVRLGIRDPKYRSVAIAAARTLAMEFAGPATVVSLKILRAHVPLALWYYRDAIDRLPTMTIEAVSGELTHAAAAGPQQHE